MVVSSFKIKKNNGKHMATPINLVPLLKGE